MTVSTLLPSLPIVTAITALFGQWIMRYQQSLAKVFHCLMSTLLLIISCLIMKLVTEQGELVMSLGGWVYPYAIQWQFDGLSTTMLLVFSVTIFSLTLFNSNEEQGRWYYVSFWLLVLGVIGAIAANDLFNLYVWFEVIFISSLLIFSQSHHRHKGALARYLILNLISTFMLLLAIAFIYGTTGQLNLHAIALVLNQPHNATQAMPFVALLLFALLVKCALFPVYHWLPRVYPTVNSSKTALVAGLVTKVAMLVLLKLSIMWLPLHSPLMSTLLLVIALFTMVLGVLGAAISYDFKYILSFHVVSQLGYIALAISLGSQIALVAAMYLIIHNVFVKTNLFLVCAQVEQSYGTCDLTKLGNWLQSHKLSAFIFFLSAFSLAGFPPLSGFWGKFLLIKATLEQHAYVSTAIAILVSLFTLYSMTKIWNHVFCQSVDCEQNIKINTSYLQYAAMSILLIASLIIALFPNSVLPRLNNGISHLIQQYQGI